VGGPGTELKKLLAGIGIEAADCKCNSRAAYMDRQAAEWCESKMATIVGWLREAARDRKLPFVEFVARGVVRKAIKNARRAR
jgi:hypothetical protein